MKRLIMSEVVVVILMLITAGECELFHAGRVGSLCQI